MAKAPKWLWPTKQVLVEILGGGRSVKKKLDTARDDPVVAEQALAMFRISAGGEVGRSHMGMSAGNLMRVRRGEQLDDTKYGQTHFYTLVEKIDEPKTLLLRFHYTAGPTFTPEGPTPGWVNRAIRRFVEANYQDININRIVEFWIGIELRSRDATTIERSLL